MTTIEPPDRAMVIYRQFSTDELLRILGEPHERLDPKKCYGCVAAARVLSERKIDMEESNL